MGHALALRIDRWTASLTMGQEVNATALQVSANLRSLSLKGSRDPGKPVSEKDARDILANAQKTLQVQQYPQISYTSTSAEGTWEAVTLEGNLTLHDQTRPQVRRVTATESGCHRPVRARPPGRHARRSSITRRRHLGDGIRPQLRRSAPTPRDVIALVASSSVAGDRLSRDDFYDTLAALDEAGLKKALWTLYWRGSAPVRERIMAAIDPASAAAQAAKANAAVDAHAIAAEVREFAALARDGAYLAGDRRVSPKERTRWRFTFQRLAKATTQALTGRDVEPAASAMATLIDLACELRSVDYFRSDDPVEAARFVVSDAAAVLWGAIRREQGSAAFCELAASQLMRWESRWGWTRRGEGWVSERETSLAQVIAGMLPAADAWGQFADAYLRALDAVAGQWGTADGSRQGRKERREDLAEWHALLRERLAHGEYEDRLDALAHHPALVGRR